MIVAVALIVASGVLAWASNFNPTMIAIFGSICSAVAAFYFTIHALTKLKEVVGR